MDSACPNPRNSINYQRVQEAIDCAQAGDRLLISAGTYTEQITVGKNLTISGENRATAIIDGNSTGRVVTVEGAITLTIDNLTFENGSDAAGGGIYTSNSTVTLNSVIIRDSQATTDHGGAIFTEAGTIQLVETTLSNNSAAVDGGAVYTEAGTVTITSSTFDNNSAGGRGGALFTRSGSVESTNTTISANTASSASASIHTEAGNLQLRHNTIFENVGGIANEKAVITATGTILAANGIDCVGAFQSTGYNLIQSLGESCSLSGAVATDIYGSPATLGPLADNGGITFTHRPLDDSVVLDVVPPNVCDVTTDQRGIRRHEGFGCEIGALESPAVAPSIVYADKGGAVVYGREKSAFQILANDPSIGTDDGVGITSVEIQLRDPTDIQLAQNIDMEAPYCLFGEDETGCLPMEASEWNMLPIDSYVLEAHVIFDSGFAVGQQLWRPFDLVHGGFQPDLDTLLFEETQTAIDATVYDAPIGLDNGSGISSVSFVFSNADETYQQIVSDNAPPYCPFGESSEGCNTLLDWGTLPIGAYLLQMQVTTTSGYVTNTLNQPIELAYIDLLEPRENPVPVITTVDETLFRASIYDPVAGTADGDGISTVFFILTDENDNILLNTPDSEAPFCANEDYRGECHPIPTTLWNDLPNGQYKLHVVFDTESGFTNTPLLRELEIVHMDWAMLTEKPGIVRERAFSNLGPAIYDPAVGSVNGSGIVSATFSLLDENDNVLYTQTDFTAPYCVFGETTDGCDIIPESLWSTLSTPDDYTLAVDVEHTKPYTSNTILRPFRLFRFPPIQVLAFDVRPDHLPNGNATIDLSLRNLGDTVPAPPSLSLYYSTDEVCDSELDTLVGEITLGPITNEETSLQSLTTMLDTLPLLATALAQDTPNPSPGAVSTTTAYLCLDVRPLDRSEDPDEPNYQIDDITFFPWDLNNDGVVTPQDGVTVINRIGSEDLEMDINNDGVIDQNDAELILERLGYVRNAAVEELTEVNVVALSALNITGLFCDFTANPELPLVVVVGWVEGESELEVETVVIRKDREGTPDIRTPKEPRILPQDPSPNDITGMDPINRIMEAGQSERRYTYDFEVYVDGVLVATVSQNTHCQDSGAGFLP